MTLDAGLLRDIQSVYPDAQAYDEVGISYVHIPGLEVAARSGTEIRDALLCLGTREGYPTRLFLSAPIEGSGQNWTAHQILGRTWHVCSVNGINGQQGPLQILAEHLRLMR